MGTATTNGDIHHAVEVLQRQMGKVQLDVTELKRDMHEVKSITGQVDDIFQFTRTATKLFKWLGIVVGSSTAVVGFVGLVQGWFS
jgi:hypothetical protein